MRFEISCVMETNNNISPFSFHKQEQLTTVPSTNCCISGCPAITNSLVPFPPRHTKEYIFWLRACKDSEANIIFKQNPMICALHFRRAEKIPMRYVTKEGVDVLNEDLERINHCVAEWLLFMRKNASDKVINDIDVYKKAMEIGRVYQQPHFELGIDFGWINIFENYLRSRDIASWHPEAKIYQIDHNEHALNEESMPDDAAEDTIKTYDEALKRVKILYSYCKRTQNDSAMEIIERLNEVLKKRV